jgi:hypothetical protein
LFNFDHSVKMQLRSPHFTCFRTLQTGQILKSHSIRIWTYCVPSTLLAAEVLHEINTKNTFPLIWTVSPQWWRLCSQ